MEFQLRNTMILSQLIRRPISCRVQPGLKSRTTGEMSAWASIKTTTWLLQPVSWSNHCLWGWPCFISRAVLSWTIVTRSCWPLFWRRSRNLPRRKKRFLSSLIPASFWQRARWAVNCKTKQRRLSWFNSYRKQELSGSDGLSLWTKPSSLACRPIFIKKISARICFLRVLGRLFVQPVTKVFKSNLAEQNCWMTFQPWWRKRKIEKTSTCAAKTIIKNSWILILSTPISPYPALI